MSNGVPITVVYPHYLATEWMIRSITSHRKLASNPIQVVVIDMSNKESGYSDVVQKTAGMVENVVWFKVNRHRYYCAEVLEVVLPMVATIIPDGITVLSDTDTLMLRKGWDDELRSVLTDHGVAGINPRSEHTAFRNVVEWNWMAFRSKTIRSFSDDAGLTDYDWGHYVQRRYGMKVKLWKFQNAPSPRNGIAAVCGDEKGPWVFHAFFSTSKLAGDKRDHSLALTDEEMNDVCHRLLPDLF